MCSETSCATYNPCHVYQANAWVTIPSNRIHVYRAILTLLARLASSMHTVDNAMLFYRNDCSMTGRRMTDTQSLERNIVDASM